MRLLRISGFKVNFEKPRDFRNPTALNEGRVIRVGIVGTIVTSVGELHDEPKIVVVLGAYLLEHLKVPYTGDCCQNPLGIGEKSLDGRSGGSCFEAENHLMMVGRVHGWSIT